MSERKTCGMCREGKPLDAFHANKNNPDGRTSRCKVCACAVTKDWKKRQPAERIKEAAKRYYRRHSKRLLALHKERYGEANKARLAAMYQANKEVFKARAKQWKQDHPERTRELNAKWDRAHPLQLRQKDATRRARLKALTVGPVSYEAIVERDGGRCWMCGCAPVGKDLHIDHVIPVSRGGPHTMENLKVSCRLCNQKKGARIIAFAA